MADKPAFAIKTSAGLPREAAIARFVQKGEVRGQRANASERLQLWINTTDKDEFMGLVHKRAMALRRLQGGGKFSQQDAMLEAIAMWVAKERASSKGEP